MKRRMRTALLLCFVLLLSVVLAGCSKKAEPAPSLEPSQAPSESVSVTPQTKADVNVATISGPTGMGMAYMMEQAEKGETGNNYDFTLATAPDEIVAKLTSKEVDIAAIPANLAATLYNKTDGSVQVAAVNTLGMMYIMQDTGGDKDKIISSISGLEGKTVYMAGQGSTPEYVFDYILKANDLEGKVEIKYLSEHSEVVAMLMSGKAEFVLLPEPFISTVGMQLDESNEENIGVVLNLNTEWQNIAESGSNPNIIMGCVVVRTEFAEENKEAVDTFLRDYFESIEYTNAYPAETGKLIEKHGILASAALAETAIPSCMIAYMDGIIMKESVEAFLEVLYDAEPSSVGGALPAADFYYQK